MLAAALLFGAALPSRAYQREITEQARTIAATLNQGEKTSVAVVDFTDLQGRATELGRFLAEELSVSLAASERRFEVVDRTHLKAILREAKLSTTGLIDPQTARQLGKIAGVEHLVTGTITPFSDNIHLTIKVLNSETAKIAVSTMVDIPKTQVISDLMKSDLPGEGPGEGRSSSTAEQSQQIFEDEGVRWELEGCSTRGNFVECTMKATSLHDDRRIGIGYGVAFDDVGLQYGRAERSPMQVTVGNGSSTLVAGTSTRVVASFSGLSPSAKKLALLRIDWRVTKAEFRNIPLVRR